MPAVFVHGVPEVPAVWAPLLSRLSRKDVVALRLPGFGGPRPDGFDATKESYVDWLVAAVEEVGADGPVDLVGHDWGAGFVGRLVSTRPDLVRSWVTDAAGMGDPGFAWHDLALAIQTPGAGEELMAQDLAMPKAEYLAMHVDEYGLPAEHADAALAPVDHTLTDCILALYRSAVHLGKEWAPDFHRIPVPGLAIVPELEVHLSPESAVVGAERAGARVVRLPGVAHWWMLQDPALGAGTLEEFWSSLN